MANRYIRRGAALTPGQTGTAAASPIYVNSSTGILMLVTGATGTTEVAQVDASSVQTLTNKTLTAPIITGGAGIADTITVDAADAAVPITGGTVVFTKGSASAHTLAAPAVLGTTLTLYAGSAQAHVITATGLIDDGITGGSKTTITLASFIGSSIVLRACQSGKWGVLSKNVVTSIA